MAGKCVLAEKDYVKGMKYKDTAEKYNVSINTVKLWKKRYGWNRDKGAPIKKSVHTKNVVHQKEILMQKEIVVTRPLSEIKM
ncbi:helix-turn-helix domain-containing protein [Microbacteriaceae bacterium 4G12]